ncbi:MAG: tetraacyldisaccharide 4'-kinase, partial [Xanthomonadales bacterium]|nr:tetraacyldisaccharide 4'-kinase [Xanthomonadales bacterium]
MRARLARKLEQTWYGSARPGALLKFLEKVYYLGFRIHQRYQLARRATDLEHSAIIVVGNLTAGGTGKTPFVIRLVELAREAGFTPGVVSRGHGRLTNEPVSVHADSDPAECGDEPVLIARRARCPVQVDSEREQAVRLLFGQGVNLVIADDGLQRSRLPRQLEICVVDRQKGAGNGHLLPAGPLREPLSRLGNIEIVVEHCGPGVLPDEAEASLMQLQPGRFTRLHGDDSCTAEGLRSQGGKIHAIAGIADPQRFWKTLAELGLEFEAHPFPDHHVFRMRDFSGFPAAEIVVM